MNRTSNLALLPPGKGLNPAPGDGVCQQSHCEKNVRSSWFPGPQGWVGGGTTALLQGEAAGPPRARQGAASRRVNGTGPNTGKGQESPFPHRGYYMWPADYSSLERCKTKPGGDATSHPWPESDKGQQSCGETRSLVHCWAEWKMVQPLWKSASKN